MVNYTCKKIILEVGIMAELKKRKLFSKIINFIEDEEIIVIHGSRQVGKTSLLRYIINNYLKIEHCKSNIFYFDLEDFQLLDLCNNSVEDVVAYLKAKGAVFDKKVYLFIDEIQYLSNPSSFLKLFYDRYKEKIKLVVSGSSSFMIRKKFKDSLAGRIVDFELFTLDFEEFLTFKNLKYDLAECKANLLHAELTRYYEEFIIFGGYPSIVLEDITEKKEVKLKQIINTYIKKDIRDLAEIREIDKFNNLIKILASQTGNLLNILELSNTIGLSKQTVREYIFLLENTYIIRRISPFYKNIRSELTKMPKIFFEDTGMANILINKTFSLNVSGNLLENSIYSQLRKNLTLDDIYFWRTNKKQEIDFIIDYVNKNKKRLIMALEVKKMFLSKHITCFNYFNKAYPEVRNCICCLSKKENIAETTRQLNNLNIIYPWQLLDAIS